MFKTKSGFSLLEVTIAMAIFVIFLGAATQAMTSAASTAVNMDRELSDIRAVEDVSQELRFDIRNADPDSFVFTDLTTKVIFSYKIASPEAAFDLRGRVIYDVGYLVTYDHLTKQLKVESHYLTGPSSREYKPASTLHVEKFGVYCHKWYKTVQFSLDGRLLTARIRNPHRPNLPDGSLDPHEHPFLPLDVSWRNDPRIGLPAEVDMYTREVEDGLD